MNNFGVALPRIIQCSALLYFRFYAILKKGSDIMIKERLLEKNYPPVLSMSDGRAVTPSLWNERRREMLSLLEKYSYGRMPSPPVTVSGSVLSSDKNAYAGKVTDIHKGVVFIRLSNGVNAIAHSCYDFRTPGKKDDVSFVVTRLDEDRGVAVGIITRVIRQNL